MGPHLSFFPVVFFFCCSFQNTQLIYNTGIGTSDPKSIKTLASLFAQTNLRASNTQQPFISNEFSTYHIGISPLRMLGSRYVLHAYTHLCCSPVSLLSRLHRFYRLPCPPLIRFCSGQDINAFVTYKNKIYAFDGLDWLEDGTGFVPHAYEINTTGVQTNKFVLPIANQGAIQCMFLSATPSFFLCLRVLLSSSSRYLSY